MKDRACGSAKVGLFNGRLGGITLSSCPSCRRLVGVLRNECTGFLRGLLTFLKFENRGAYNDTTG
jgi:hypothetical protein